jgi:hypothetical protein
MNKKMISGLLLAFTIVFLAISLKMNAQKYRLYGEVSVMQVNFLNDTVLTKAHSFEIYLSNDSILETDIVLLKKVHGNAFDIKLSKSKFKKYQFVHIGIEKQFKVFRLSTIINQRQKVVFDKPISNDPEIIVKKPAIYLYPTQEQSITVRHEFKGQILTTYPEYQDGWNVIAHPDGSLFNTSDQRTYGYLFWDGSYHFPQSHYQFEDGFVVSKSENIAFLQEKLSILGLNNTEINDFIVFWLPVLNENDQNFIHFRVNDNIDQSSILNIDPQPDTLIRVFMEFKPMKNDETMSVKEQVLPKLNRIGFTVVEWGGAELPQVNLISETIK